MRARSVALFIFISALAWSASPFPSHAEIVPVYAQPDDSGEMASTQPNFQNTYISANLGNLVLGKDVLTITFTMKDPNASNAYGQPGGVAMGTCATCQDLQKYLFTGADRTLLSDGALHAFTVQTGTTTYDDADGTVPIYINFFNLSQYHTSTHLKSNADGTVPALTITAPEPPPSSDIAPKGSTVVYTQGDKTAVMSNPQATFQNAHIDSESLGNLNLGQGKLYVTFTMKDPNASNAYGQPAGVCIQEASSTGCSSALQTYFFTNADRTLLSDGGFHTFNVETGTTTRSYADGTHPVSIGFFGLSQYQYGTKVKSNATATIPYLTVKTAPPLDPCAGGGCVSNVLFLPGIESSRLYEGMSCGKTAEEKLWDPVADSLIKILRGAGDDKVKRLFLDSAGKSVCSDIYAKVDDVIDSVRGSNIYKSFIDEMNGLKTDGMINAWKPVAYDWRLSLTDLLNKGTERDGKIFYAEATSTPYIEQTLRALASSSKTGKVTIVAHSNGGLVAKALLNQLGGETSKLLVDKLVMVGAPQSGAPIDIGALLYGMDQGISSWGVTILHDYVARELAENSPMAYHLLPSEDYLKSIANDANHPVARFTGDAYAKEIGAYGATVNNTTELDNFILASTTLNSNLIDYANSQHTALDSWTPPDGIEVSQIAGWGADTVAGIDFYTSRAVSALTSLAPVKMYKPIFTEDGDGTVPVPSALMMATSTSVKRYWVNLFAYNNKTSSSRKHKDLFEIPQLEDFVKNIIINSTSTFPIFISSTQPPPETENKKLTFFLHSPLTLELADSFGNVTGLATDGSMTQDIPGSSYGEFGEVKYIIVPEGNYTLSMNGQANGTFTLEMQESSGGAVTATSTIANVPTTANTLASLTISGGINTASALAVDEDGDGATDITITPQLGETVNYEPPAPASAPEPQVSSGGGGGWESIPVPVPIATTTASKSSPQATTTVIQTSAKSTPEVIVSTTTIVQAKKKPPSSISVAPPKEVNTQQTASAYNAFQQPLFARLGNTVYNGIHSFWLALKKFF